MAPESLSDILSGRRKGAPTAILRLGLALAEVGYTAIVRLRNRMYDRRILTAHRLPRPAVSIGNLTTGGTGKTPMVCWIASTLRSAGLKPCVLMRGYKSDRKKSDECELISQLVPGIAVVADPDRLRGAAVALSRQPDMDLFLLDDAMQHRRAARNFEIVLVSASEPWGYGHILPRGLLREPISGIRRADAVILTHASEVSESNLSAIELVIRRFNPNAPIFRADHVETHLLSADGQQATLSSLKDEKYFLACGIGQPASFLAAMKTHGPHCVGRRFFSDHHRFSPTDVAYILRAASETGAGLILVTEKDWTKLSEIPAVRKSSIPFWRVQMDISFANDAGKQLIEMLRSRIAT